MLDLTADFQFNASGGAQTSAQEGLGAPAAHRQRRAPTSTVGPHGRLGFFGLRVLIIEDDADVRLGCLQALALADIDAQGAEAVESLPASPESGFAGVVVCDIQLPGIDGLSFMHHVLGRDPELPFILITGHADSTTAEQAKRDGAYDFIEKPFSTQRLVDVVRRALAERATTLELRGLK